MEHTINQRIMGRITCYRNIALVAAFLIFPFMGNGQQTAALSLQRIIPLTTVSSITLEVSYQGQVPSGTKYTLEITDPQTGRALFNGPVSATSASKGKMRFSVTGLTAHPWTLTDPKLYQLSFSALTPGAPPVRMGERVGFRSVSSRDGNIYLNGKPIFLRGIAINPPGRGIPSSIETSRSFAQDYVRFMKSIHVNIIRIPDDETWYDVCDELGMMVFGGNYSGSVDGEKPPVDYDKAVAWYEDDKFAPIAHHPSLVIYAMTNETPFRGALMVKWEKFLSYAHQQLVKWDSTRLYIGNAGYGYGQSGDICDLHRYWGWYYSSPFTFIHIRNNKEIIPIQKKEIQPITFTECVGNYTGPGGQYNLTPEHKNPGSQLNWTGHAPWSEQAQLADEHQCFTFKQATELFRRLRNINSQLSGVFPFTIMFHNWNTIRSFVDMDPKAVTRQAQLSYQPVLLSWECWSPHLFAGSQITPIAHIVNDDDYFRDLKGAYLVYQIQDNTAAVQTSDTLSLPDIKYYATFQKTLKVSVPAFLPAGNYKLVGKIMQHDTMVSRNFQDLFIAGQSFVKSAPRAQRRVLLYDPVSTTGAALQKLGIPTQAISSFLNLKSNPTQTLLIIGENGADQHLGAQSKAIKEYIAAGGRILSLRQDAAHLPNLNSILSSPLGNIRMDLDTPVYPPPPRPSRNGYNINPEYPESVLFSGLRRENFRYWSDYTGWNESKPGFPAIYPVTDGFVLQDKSAIAHTRVWADYGPALDAMALAEMFQQKGSVFLCGLDLTRRVSSDPVAARMLANLVAYGGSSAPHSCHPVIDSPILWGNYASERGLITGVTSGLLLNGKPRLSGNLDKLPLVIAKEGYEFAGHRGGFNSRPGIQYVPYGRRPFGPYHLRDFGNIPVPDTENGNVGQGVFWCTIPSGKKVAKTTVWNPSSEPLSLEVEVNGHKASQQIGPGKTEIVACPVDGTDLRVSYRGDRRLVLLETSFN